MASQIYRFWIQAWGFNFLRIAKFELFGAPKWLNLPVLNLGLSLQLSQNRKIWAVWGTKVAKFTSFESRPEPSIFSESQNLSCLGRQSGQIYRFWIQAWGFNFLRIAKFELFGAPKWLNLLVLNLDLSLQFSQNRKIWAVWGANVAKFTGFESRPEPSIFSESQNLSCLGHQSG